MIKSLYQPEPVLLEVPMKKKLIYLSGPINGHTIEEAGGWRKKAAALLELNLLGSLDPMRGKTHFEPGITITPEICRSGEWISKDQVIIERDLRDLRDCSGVLVYVGVDDTLDLPIKPMTGTVCEVFAAKYLFDVPLPCVAFREPGDGIHPQFYSPWFGKFLTPEYGVCDTIGEAIDFLIEVIW